ncbi:MAG TPA: YCF48-related protein [Candidatus Binatia bacterium]
MSGGDLKKSMIENYALRVASRVAVVLVLTVMAVSRAGAAPHNGVRITDNLYGARFVDADNGWTVGAFGTIFRTRDGGKTWRPQVSHTTELLFSVDFADARHGWITGRSGLILHTSDGGDTWQTQHSGTDRHLFDLKAIDQQHVWAVGDWGTVMATRDGGTTWENHSLERDVILNAQSWADPDHGWIVGEAGAIVATGDGGKTWNEQPSGIEKSLFGVYFSDIHQGWAVGLDGIILRTVDGGQTWKAQQGSTEVGALEQVGFQEALGNPSLYDVKVSGKYGYVVGDIGAVLVSEDGGATWQRKDMPAEWRLRWIRSVSLVNGTHGALVGANGLTLRIVGNEVKMPEVEEHALEATH